MKTARRDTRPLAGGAAAAAARGRVALRTGALGVLAAFLVARPRGDTALRAGFLAAARDLLGFLVGTLHYCQAARLGVKAA